jgi:hypothetical protein
LSIVFVLTSKLGASMKYTSLPAGASGAVINVSAGANSFTVPITSFFVNTDALGRPASWDILGETDALTSVFTGSDQQAYSMDTLSTVIPIPGSVTGHYSYDQATIVTGNGQGLVGTYGGNTVQLGTPLQGTWTLPP